VLHGDCSISVVGILIGPALLSLHVNKLNWILVAAAAAAAIVVISDAVAVSNFMFYGCSSKEGIGWTI